MGITTEYLIGIRERASWVQETSFASGGDMATNGEVIGYNWTMDSADWGFDYQERLTAGADNRDVEALDLGRENYPFTMSWTITNAKFIKYVMDVADAGSDPYTHTFTRGNTLNTFKLEWAKRHTTNHVYTLTGCTILEYRVSWQKPSGEGREGFIKVTANCVAKAVTQGTSVTTLAAGNLTVTPFQFRHVKFTFNNSEYTEVNNGEISMTNSVNIDDSLYANSTFNGQISDPIPGVFRMNGRINVNLKDASFYTQWVGKAAITNTKIEFIRGANDDMDFTFGGFFLKNVIAPTNADGGVTKTDLVFQETGSSGSFVATDSIATY